MEIVIRRSTAFAAISIVLGIVAAAGAAELAIRVAAPRVAADRVFVNDNLTKRSADCYPRAAGVSFPLDLARENDRRQFISWFGKAVDTIAFSRAVTAAERQNSVIDGITHGLETRKAASELASALPLCVTYDRQTSSSRFLVKSPGATQTIALLGDSFVFGQGIAADATFSAQLAHELNANVHSYARNAANMGEIEAEFELAMRAASHEGFSSIVYVYVLNDPYQSPKFSSRLERLNARINQDSSWLAALNSVSALSRRLTEAVVQRMLASETLRWYSDLHDPQLNPGILLTIDKLAVMTREARTRGIDFVVLVYPLMQDMASYPLPDVHRRLGELAARSGVELHDMLPAFEARGRGANLVVHPLDYHPNALAQGIAAQDAAAFLRARKVRK